ncbi:MAG: DUF6587 family protein [Steroidobacteraceae bacterium]
MSRLLDHVLVGLALLVSAAYAVSALGPRSLRRRVLAASSRMLARAPAALGLRRMAQWLAVRSAGKARGACGGCDGCGSEDSPAQSSDAEVRVPVAHIHRRP